LGEGPNRKAIESDIVELEMTNSVFLHGNVGVNEFYWNADIYVHSATYEPFGLVLLEAMAAGLPVVCLDGKGNRDIIEDSKNGYILSTENPEEFAHKIYNIWNNCKVYNAMSQYAIEFAEKYDIKPYVDKLLDIYTSRN